jgi:thiamine pyrophosphate-dependent acetolactate synthase large subunit-like protein
MKDLVKQYLDRDISRRKLMTGLSAVGMTTVAAEAMAQSLAPFAASAKDSTPNGAMRDAMREMTATGGMLYVQQLKAAGVKFIFANPSTGDAPIYDALVSERSIQLIKGIQEGACVAMGDGYARMSGKIAIVQVAGVGLPNALTQMVNTFKDHIPMLLTIGSFGRNKVGADTTQDYDFQNDMVSPITKWRWTPMTGMSVPESTRRAIKFASTPPAGPVFLSIPDDVLRAPATGTIMDQALFDVPMEIRPRKTDVEKAARMLIEAQNPLLSVGDEITLCQGEKEVLELAELLGLPVSGEAQFGSWSKPFPTRNPLYIGPTLRTMRFPGEVDVHLNVGSHYSEIPMRGAKLISIRQDPTSLARVTPVDLPMVADVRLATIDLIEAVKSMATASRLKEIAEVRAARTGEYTKKQREFLQQISKSAANVASSIRRERLAFELETGIDKEAIYVTDCDSGKAMDPLMAFGGSDKTYVSTGPNILGWGVAASFGVKLARPDRPVVSILGDGSMQFGGPQPLWSMARYQAPVTVIVYNNRSYNNERNRIWTFGQGAQLKEGVDMLCYNGSPDIDFAKAASAFGVEGEVVSEPDKITASLDRAKRANIEGRPYLLDIHVDRDGVGAASTWYPRYSIADQRTKKV